MEVDEIQTQVRKFQRVSSNGSTTTTDNSSNPQKIATHRGNLEFQKFNDGGGGGNGGGGGGIDVVVGGGGGGGGGVARLCGWPSSRIVRVSRASGGKDRHSKVLTSKGLRDRRVRLSVSTAIQFYDLQDRLGYDQPSKAVEWLLKAASTSIDELPSLDPSFPGALISHNNTKENRSNFEDPNNNDNDNRNDNNDNVCKAKSPGNSSTSETSKGSGLSLSRSENRMKARERAREMASKKEREKETDAAVLNRVNFSENSSFTDLLTKECCRTTTTTTTPWAATPMDYFFARPSSSAQAQLIQIPQFGDSSNNSNNSQQQHQFSFLQDNESYNLNFSMTSAGASGGALAPGYSRGTLQSNLPSSVLPLHHHFQRFQSPSIDGSTSTTNLPFFIVPNAASDHFPATGGYHLSYGGGGGDHHKEKSKN